METLTQNEINFARNLDEKLQLIQGKDNNLYSVIHNDLTTKNLKNSKNMLNDQRPQFMTTVKKGVFLEPPPEVAALLGLSPVKSSVNSPLSSSSASCASTVTAGTQAPSQVIMYSYSSKPKVLNKNYHNECGRTVLNNARDGAAPYGNLMYDRRVVRGSTYGANPTPQGEETQARQREARRRAQARRRARGCSSKMRQGTPPPVPGRKHEPVQTERYLEELLDRPAEADASCQTDLFVDTPQEPPYLSGLIGEDKETQIYPGDLFDFDYEAAPIIENIVIEAIEKGLVEILEEEELLDIQVQQRRLQEVRALEELQQQHLGSEFDFFKDQPSTGRADLFKILPTVIMKLQAEGITVNDSDLEWLLESLNDRLYDPELIEALAREILEGRSSGPGDEESPGEEFVDDTSAHDRMSSAKSPDEAMDNGDEAPEVESKSPHGEVGTS